MVNTNLSYTVEDLKEAIAPISSLISKSEKSQQKLKSGTWQHNMLRDNLEALHLALGIINTETGGPDNFAPNDSRKALQTLASMISKTEKYEIKFLPGTPQHTLQRNRVKALRVAAWLITQQLIDA